MIKIITNNMFAKIVCLVLALSFWTYVVSNEAKVDNFPGSIPLETRNRPENLVVVKDISEVEIRILAERGVWKQLSSGSFQAYIDLSGLGQGTHELTVNVRSEVEGVQIVEVKPAKVLVSMEPVVNKTIDIKEKVEGNAADGMIARKIQLNPSSVDVSGPESIIERISEAVAPILLDGEDNSFTRSVSLKAYDESGEEYSNIVFSPKEVEADVTIVKAAQTKTVGIKVNLEGRVDSGYWISKVSTDPSIITITGSTNDLADIDYLSTDTLNIESLNKNKIESKSLNIPDGISLVERSNTTVSVSIELSSLDTTKEINGGFTYSNLASNLKVTNVDVNNLRIIVAGSTDKINSINASEVNATLDLSGFTKAGTYAVDIKKASISIPNGISVANYIPSSVRITLEDK